MKKLLSLAFCAASALAFADDIVCGEVGVIQVTSDQQNTVIAAAFGDLASGGDIEVANIVKTTGLASGDQLFVFKDGSFSGWTYNDESNSWDAVAANVLLDENGNIKSVAGTAATDEPVVYGSGVWLKRATKPSAAFTIAVYGKPVAKTISVAAGTTVLCGNPTYTGKEPKIEGAQTGDIIRVPSDALLLTTYRFNGSAWKHASGASIVEGLPTIPAGTGFWYQAADSGAARTLTWSN